jgi:hypothetical protein
VNVFPPTEQIVASQLALQWLLPAQEIRTDFPLIRFCRSAGNPNNCIGATDKRALP